MLRDIKTHVCPNMNWFSDVPGFKSIVLLLYFFYVPGPNTFLFRIFGHRKTLLWLPLFLQYIMSLSLCVYVYICVRIYVSGQYIHAYKQTITCGKIVFYPSVYLSIYLDISVYIFLYLCISLYIPFIYLSISLYREIHKTNVNTYGEI